MSIFQPVQFFFLRFVVFALHHSRKLMLNADLAGSVILVQQYVVLPHCTEKRPQKLRPFIRPSCTCLRLTERVSFGKVSLWKVSAVEKSDGFGKRFFILKEHAESPAKDLRWKIFTKDSRQTWGLLCLPPFDLRFGPELFELIANQKKFKTQNRQILVERPVLADWARRFSSSYQKSWSGPLKALPPNFGSKTAF